MPTWWRELLARFGIWGPFRAAFRRTHEIEQEHLAFVLASYPSRDAWALACEVLKDPKQDARTRSRAARAVGLLGGGGDEGAGVEAEATVAILCEALGDPEIELRCAAAQALERRFFCARLDQWLLLKTQAVRARVPTHAGPACDPRTLNRLDEPCVGRAVDALSTLLRDERVEVRLASVSALMVAGHPPTTAEPLIGALADLEPRVREAAADALGDLRDARARGPLERLLDLDPVERVRECARHALETMKLPRVILP